jgi:hypothetical protein
MITVNGNGGATAKPRIIRGASLAHQDLAARRLACLAAEILEGKAIYEHTRKELAELFGVSGNYIDAARKLPRRCATQSLQGTPQCPSRLYCAPVNWFFANFEDTVQSIPWDEGKYVFIWGGPYYAHEELEDAFGATATERALTAAINQIEQEGGPQWAPSSHRMRPEQSAI